MSESRRPRARSVRLRLTLVATLVAAVAVVAAGLWLVHAVESTMSNRLTADAQADIATVTQALETDAKSVGGDAKGVISPELIAEVTADGQTLQVFDASGAPVASTPGEVSMASGDTRSIAGSSSDERTVTSADVGTGADRYRIVVSSSLEPVRRSVSAVKRGLAFSLPLLVVFVAAMAWWLAGRALRPVEAIRSEVERISGSTLSSRVPARGSGDEIDRLASTMNEMLDRLESSSIRQREFVADASHELRSPVTAIRAQLEVARYAETPADWHEIVDAVLTEESRLEDTLTDLLMSASLDEGAPVPNPAPVDLGETARVVVDRARTDRPEVTLDDAFDAAIDGLGKVSGEAVVRGSALHLERAVRNLVDNASRHAASRVVVTVGATDDAVTVTVDDDGPGIPDADRERVFERFTRLDGHRARQTAGGAGLGLHLVRQIASRHGGSVHVETSPLGGARMVFAVSRGTSSTD